MTLLHLPSIIARKKKRLGRGHGSGKVKTSGRGTKGQNARGTMPIPFEGGQLSLIKRIPFLRGKTRNASRHTKAFPVNIGKLTIFPGGSHITLDALKKKHVIDAHVTKIKILGIGLIKEKLDVHVPCSKSVLSEIEKAGGKVHIE